MPRGSRVSASVVGLLIAGTLIAIVAMIAPFPARGATSPGGITSLGESIVLDEPVAGDVQLLGGEVLIETRVEGNVIAFGADVTLDGDAEIMGDVFALGGNVTGATGNVRGSIFAPASLAAAVEGAHDGSRPIIAATSRPFSLVTIALKLSLLLMWLVAAVAIVLFDGRGVRVSSLEVRASTFHSVLLGLVAFTSFVLTAVVFSYLVPFVVGLLLLFILGLFAIVTKIYGMIAIFHALGTWIARPSSRDELRQRRWLKGDLAMVVLGLLVLGILRMIPLVGNLVWMLASLMGVGVALSTRFGRRDPAFLAWRAPVVASSEE